MTLPPLVELIYAANKIANLNALEAIDGPVPYSWLLRFRTMLWYLDSLGASPRFLATVSECEESGAMERMVG